LGRVVDSPRSLAFFVEFLWDGRTGGQASLGEHGSLKIDALPEFGGEGKHPCPDELFLAAIGGCLLTTFLYFRRKLRLPLLDLKVSVGGEVRLRGPEGYRLSPLEAAIHVRTLKGQRAKAEGCVKLTRDFCHLTKLVEGTVPVELSAKIDYVEEGTSPSKGSSS